MIILSDKEADFIRSLVRSLKERTESTSEHDRCDIAIKTLGRKSTPADAVRMWCAAHPEEAEVEIRRTG